VAAGETPLAQLEPFANRRQAGVLNSPPFLAALCYDMRACAKGAIGDLSLEPMLIKPRRIWRKWFFYALLVALSLLRYMRKWWHGLSMRKADFMRRFRKLRLWFHLR
jgi:hypothetical protein